MVREDGRDLSDLLALTGLATASGREQRVVEWVRQWARRRRRIQLREDAHGNLLLKRPAVTSRKPIVFAAHMDHPAFVVTEVTGKRVVADFRGGVRASYFKRGTRVELHPEGGPVQRGRLTRYIAPKSDSQDPSVVATFDKPVEGDAGDVMRWALPAPKTSHGALRAPACDDLAGVAAALEALDQLGKAKRDVRVLLTRAEEVGFVGAMAACHSGTIPKGARIVALENSKSYAESPLGAGPIVRVGDKTSTFDPDLTYRVDRIGAQLHEQDNDFRWQRRLMPGGTCEASAYQALGYAATCVCLPLANYHNMNERSGKIDSERIDLGDYHSLVRFLGAIARGLDDGAAGTPLKQRLDALFRQRKPMLRE